MINLNNKKGSLYSAIMVALIVFMVGMITVNFLKGEITNSRTDINCVSPATDGTKLLCLIGDSVIPYFIVLVLSIALGVITEKVLI